MDFFMSVLARCCGHSLGMPAQYKFIKRLGKGTEGDVWLATDSVRNALVAIKLVPRGPPAWRLAMVGREGRMLARLGFGHINIVRPLEIVLTSGFLAFVTEYVPGGSMSDFLGRRPCDEDVARYLFKQLASAIAYCHGRKIVYRDVKPANILLTTTNPPFVKLCDFGLAHTWDGRALPTFATLAGTPGYMSPEIVGGFFKVKDKRAKQRQQQQQQQQQQQHGKQGSGGGGSGGGNGGGVSSNLKPASAAATGQQQQQQQHHHHHGAAGAPATGDGTAAAGGVIHSGANDDAAAAAMWGSVTGAVAGNRAAAAAAAVISANAAADAAADDSAASSGVSSSSDGGGGGGGAGSSTSSGLDSGSNDYGDPACALDAPVMLGAEQGQRPRQPPLPPPPAGTAAGTGTGAAAAAAAAGPELVAGGSGVSSVLSVPHEYDGTKADVYSCGVLLVVMLLHTMPWHYDAYAARLPPLDAMRMTYNLEVKPGASWRDATMKADRLSAPLAALLDRMLDPDVTRRATMDEVLASEWVNLPLPPRLQVALDVLNEQQAERAAASAAAAGGATAPTSDPGSVPPPPPPPPPALGLASAGSSCVADGYADSSPHHRRPQALGEDEIALRLAEFEEMLREAEVAEKGLFLVRRLPLTLPSRRALAAAMAEQRRQQAERQALSGGGGSLRLRGSLSPSSSLRGASPPRGGSPKGSSVRGASPPRGGSPAGSSPRSPLASSPIPEE